MEERKTIFDYVGTIFSTFGFSVVVLNVFCLLFGEQAQDFSSIFSMGKEGLSTETMMQFLGAAVLMVFLRFLFFTDRIIKNMSVVLRTLCMVLTAIGIVVIFTLRFGWFPVDQWLPWFMFFLSFGICFLVSSLIAVLKEKSENKKMEEALARLKQERGMENEGMCD